MREIAFYEVVDVLSSPNAQALGVGNTPGVVVGISGEASERRYAVLVGDRTFMLDPSDLAPTGQSLDREAIYGGEAIAVSPQRYSNDET
jgi:hypothetical protein